MLHFSSILEADQGISRRFFHSNTINPFESISRRFAEQAVVTTEKFRIIAHKGVRSHLCRPASRCVRPGMPEASAADRASMMSPARRLQMRTPAESRAMRSPPRGDVAVTKPTGRARSDASKRLHRHGDVVKNLHLSTRVRTDQKTVVMTELNSRR